jgi:hypothetical protein
LVIIFNLTEKERYLDHVGKEVYPLATEEKK